MGNHKAEADQLIEAGSGGVALFDNPFDELVDRPGIRDHQPQDSD
jgi:hypothetical protein